MPIPCWLLISSLFFYLLSIQPHPFATDRANLPDRNMTLKDPLSIGRMSMGLVAALYVATALLLAIIAYIIITHGEDPQSAQDTSLTQMDYEAPYSDAPAFNRPLIQRASTSA
jgi:hypothetical protein